MFGRKIWFFLFVMLPNESYSEVNCDTIGIDLKTTTTDFLLLSVENNLLKKEDVIYCLHQQLQATKEIENFNPENEQDSEKEITPAKGRETIRISENNNDIPDNSEPTIQRIIDMSDSDGSLRDCYANGGMAKQLQDYSYICEKNDADHKLNAYTLPSSASSAIAPSAPQIIPSGTTNKDLINCIDQGGILIQLSSSSQFACAM